MELWIGHVDSALESIRCPVGRQTELVQTLFRDLAQHWWRSVRDQVTGYEQMKTLIRARFCPSSLRREKLRDFVEAGFDDVPVSEAIRRFQEELALLGPAAPSGDQHVYLFSRRLRDTTRAYMAGFHCESLMDYQDRAADYERERMSQRRASQTGGSEKRQRTGQTSGAGGSASGWRSQRRPSQPSSAPVAEKRRQCFNCGDPGHMRPECTRPLVTCYTCGRQGHRAAYCRQGGAASRQGSSPASVAGGGQRPPQQHQQFQGQ